MRPCLGVCTALLLQLTSSPPVSAQIHAGIHCSQEMHKRLAKDLKLSRLQTQLHNRILKYHKAGNARAMNVAHKHFMASLNSRQKEIVMKCHDEAHSHGINRKIHDRMASELKLSEQQLAIHDQLVDALHRGEHAKATELHDAFVETLSSRQREIVKKYHP